MNAVRKLERLESRDGSWKHRARWNTFFSLKNKKQCVLDAAKQGQLKFRQETRILCLHNSACIEITPKEPRSTRCFKIRWQRRFKGMTWSSCWEVLCPDRSRKLDVSTGSSLARATDFALSIALTANLHEVKAWKVNPAFGLFVSF